MSEESKFILCPSCGAILEKGIIYCSYCGANVNEKPKEGFGQSPPKESFQEKPTGQQVPPQQPHENRTGGIFGLGGYNRQNAYGDQENVYAMDQTELLKRADAERKIMLATLFSWLTFCAYILSPIFFIITIVYIIQARRALGFMDPRLTRALIYAIVGLVINIAMNIPFFLSIFNYNF
ncbi:MAG: zinc ribbon domain-containing protein [Asgard group archaeon]|nr:zinc ribbon domain-containing protein [Asgard group archaeon]